LHKFAAFASKVRNTFSTVKNCFTMERSRIAKFFKNFSEKDEDLFLKSSCSFSEKIKSFFGNPLDVFSKRSGTFSRGHKTIYF